MSNDIQIRNSEITINPETLIAKGIESGLSIEGMQKLLDMRKQLKDEYAKEEFFKSLSKFQKECPTIEKKKLVYDKYKNPRYRYAPIEDIIEQTKDALEANGFSYSFKNRQAEGIMTTICELHHIAGHTESTEITVPIGNSGFMSDIQEIGSAMTYTKRYSFCNVTGITTGDEDQDVNPPDVKPAQSAKPELQKRPVPDQPTAKPATEVKPNPSKVEANPEQPVAQTSYLIGEGELIPTSYWQKSSAAKMAMLPEGCGARKVNGVFICVRL